MGLDTVQIIGGLVIVAGSAGFSAIVVKWLERAKVSAEAHAVEASATDILTKASSDIVEMMGEQLRSALVRINAVEQSALEKDKRINELEREVADLRSHIRMLESTA